MPGKRTAKKTAKKKTSTKRSKRKSWDKTESPLRSKEQREKIAKKVVLEAPEEEKKVKNPHIAKLLKMHRLKVQSQLREAVVKGQKVIDPDQPLSEILTPYSDTPRLPKGVQTSLTKKDVCDLIRGMAALDPNRVISRNYFRCHGGLDEKTWVDFGGTWEGMKEVAKITRHRKVKRLERNIAVHAAHDHYRKLGKLREGWAAEYLRPAGKKWQTYVVFTDVHDYECDPFALRCLMYAIQKSDPDILLCLGDLFDLPEFGHFSVDPRDWNPVKRIRFVHQEILRPARELVPDAQFDLIEGNHEFRILRHCADQTPVMKAILGELHGFSPRKLLGLDEFEMNYIGKADFGAFYEKDIKKEIQRNFKFYPNDKNRLFLGHHYPHARKKHMWGACGHCHQHQMWTGENPTTGYWEFHQLGAMHFRDATFTDGERWSNGFALVHLHLPTRSTHLEYVNVSDSAVVCGDYLERDSSETVPCYKLDDCSWLRHIS